MDNQMDDQMNNQISYFIVNYLSDTNKLDLSYHANPSKSNFLNQWAKLNQSEIMKLVEICLTNNLTFHFNKNDLNKSFFQLKERFDVSTWDTKNTMIVSEHNEILSDLNSVGCPIEYYVTGNKETVKNVPIHCNFKRDFRGEWKMNSDKKFIQTEWKTERGSMRNSRNPDVVEFDRSCDDDPLDYYKCKWKLSVKFGDAEVVVRTTKICFYKRKPCFMDDHFRKNDIANMKKVFPSLLKSLSSDLIKKCFDFVS